jgi:aryl-alcohol dehydrogenase-like predicted oxidoreductase
MRQQENPEQKIHILSKGGFPFDLFWAQKLEAGTHSEELQETLRQQNILIPFRETLQSTPPGTYASRLFGSQEQITQRVSEELGHTLSNLNGDITIYLMHRDDGDTVNFAPVLRPQTPVKTIMQAIQSPEISSKFWMQGWSNWQTSRVNESVKIAEESQSPRPIINSPYFSLFEMSERSIHAIGVQVTHHEMMNPEFQKGIKIMPYSPLGGFSILDQPEPKWENAKRAAKLKYEQGDPYWQNVFLALFTKENEARWHRVVKFTQDFNLKHSTSYTVDQMLNAYVLAHERTDFLAIGPITKAQVQRTVGS